MSSRKRKVPARFCSEDDFPGVKTKLQKKTVKTCPGTSKTEQNVTSDDECTPSFHDDSDVDPDWSAERYLKCSSPDGDASTSKDSTRKKTRRRKKKRTDTKLKKKKHEDKVPGVAGKASCKKTSDNGDIQVCTVCNKGFRTLWALSQHLIDTHKAESTGRPSAKREICHICTRELAKSSMPSHLEGHREDESHQSVSGPFKCVNCLKLYHDLYKMGIHRARFCSLNATGKDVLNCTTDIVEGMSILQKKRKNSHAKESSNGGRGIIKCPHCTATFVKFETLKMHNTVVHVNKGVGIYKCELCSYQFAHKYHLRDHKRTAHGTNRFKCRHCQKLYTTVRKRTEHEKKIHLKRLRVCEYCGIMVPQYSKHPKQTCVMNPNRQPRRPTQLKRKRPSATTATSSDYKAINDQEEPITAPVSQLYVCHNCDISFENKTNYIIHQGACQMVPLDEKGNGGDGQGQNGDGRNRCGGSNDFFGCTQCPEVFPSIMTLRVHEVEHLWKACEDCGAVVPDEESFELHALLECPERYKLFSKHSPREATLSKSVLKILQSEKPMTPGIQDEKAEGVEKAEYVDESYVEIKLTPGIQDEKAEGVEKAAYVDESYVEIKLTPGIQDEKAEGVEKAEYVDESYVEIKLTPGIQDEKAEGVEKAEYVDESYVEIKLSKKSVCYQCKTCTRQFDKRHRERHKANHQLDIENQIENGEFECGQCLKQYHKESHLSRHRRLYCHHGKLQAQAEVESGKLQAEVESGKLHAQAEVDSGKLQAQAEVESGKLQAEVESGKLHAQAEVDSGKLQAQAEVDSGKLHAQAEVESGKLQTQAEVESDTLQAQAEVESGKLQTQAEVESDTLQAQAEVESGKLHTQAEVESGKLQAQAEVESGKLHAQAEVESPEDVTNVKVCGSCSLQFEDVELYLVHKRLHVIHSVPCQTEEGNNDSEDDSVDETDEEQEKNLSKDMRAQNGSKQEDLATNIDVARNDDEICEEQQKGSAVKKRKLASGKTCDSCGVKFRSSAAMKEHKKRVSMLEAKYPSKCLLCTDGWGGRPEMFSACHYLQHKKQFKFLCEFCGLHFEKTSILEKHLHRMHDFETKMECQGCHFMFGSQAYLQHVEYNRSELERLDRKCLSCGKMFESLKKLAIHSKRFHQNTCNICGRHFYVTSQLQTHQFQCHNFVASSEELLEENAYRCKHCTLSFAESSQLSAHVKSVLMADASENPLCSWEYRYSICLRCGMSFAKYSDYKLHKSIWKLDCIECNEHFKGWGSFTFHQENVHERLQNTDKTSSNQPQFFKCKYCDHAFNTVKEKRRHEFRTTYGFNKGKEVYEGKFPFPCKDCGESLGSVCDKDNHTLKHKKLKAVVSCRFCRQSFRRLTGGISLASHTRTVDEDCATCSVKLLNLCQKKMHNRKHREESRQEGGEKKMYESLRCVYCGIMCKTIKHKRVHEARAMSYKKNTKATCRCSICCQDLTTCQVKEHTRHHDDVVVGKECAYCGEVIFTSYSNIHRRFRDKVYICGCGERLQGRCQKKQHETKQFVCQKCGGHFTTLNDLLQHLTRFNYTNVDVNREINKCRGIELMEASKWATVEGEVETVYKCLYCGDKARSLEEKNCHNSAYKFECPQCKEHFRTLIAATYHFRKVKHKSIPSKLGRLVEKVYGKKTRCSKKSKTEQGMDVDDDEVVMEKVGTWEWKKTRKQIVQFDGDNLLQIYCKQSMCDKFCEQHKEKGSQIQRSVMEFQIGLDVYGIVTSGDADVSRDRLNDSGDGRQGSEDCGPDASTFPVGSFETATHQQICPCCKRKFENQSLCQQHLNSMHNATKGLFYTCVKCDQSFDTECGVRYHVAQMCQHCGEHFGDVKTKVSHAQQCQESSDVVSAERIDMEHASGVENNVETVGREADGRSTPDEIVIEEDVKSVSGVKSNSEEVEEGDRTGDQEEFAMEDNVMSVSGMKNNAAEKVREGVDGRGDQEEIAKEALDEAVEVMCNDSINETKIIRERYDGKSDMDDVEKEVSGVEKDAPVHAMIATDTRKGIIQQRKPCRIKKRKARFETLTKNQSKCEFCLKMCSRYKSYRKYCNQNDASLKWLKCVCLQCDLELPTRCHISYHHAKHKTCCPRCGMHFSAPGIMQQHTCYKCKQAPKGCELYFQSEAKLEDHVANWHTLNYEEKPATPPMFGESGGAQRSLDTNAHHHEGGSDDSETDEADEAVETLVSLGSPVPQKHVPVTMPIRQQTPKDGGIDCQPQDSPVAPQQPEPQPQMVSQNRQQPVPGSQLAIQILPQSQKEDAIACQPQQGSPAAPQQPIPVGGTNPSIANNLFQVVPGGLIGLSNMYKWTSSLIFSEKTGNYSVKLVTIISHNYLAFKYPGNHKAFITSYGQQHQGRFYVVIVPTTCSEGFSDTMYGKQLKGRSFTVVTPTSKGSAGSGNSNQEVVLAIGQRGVKSILYAQVETFADRHKAFVVQLDDCNGNALQPPVAPQNPPQPVKGPDVMEIQIQQKTQKDGINACQPEVSPVSPQPPIAMQMLQQVAMRIQQEIPKAAVTSCQPQSSPVTPQPPVASKNLQQPVKGSVMAMQILPKTPKDDIIACQPEGSPVGPVGPPSAMQILPQTQKEDATACQPQQVSPVAPHQPVRPPMVPQNPQPSVPCPTIAMQILQQTQKDDATACQPEGSPVAPQQPVRPLMVPQNPQPHVPGTSTTAIQSLQQTQKEDAITCQPQRGSSVAPQKPIPVGGTNPSIADNLFQVVPGGLTGLTELMFSNKASFSIKPIFSEETSKYFVKLATIDNLNYLVFKYPKGLNHKALIVRYGQQNQATVYVDITSSTCSNGSAGSVNSNQGYVLAIGQHGVKSVQMATQANGQKTFVVQLETCNGNTLQPAAALQNPQQPEKGQQKTQEDGIIACQPQVSPVAREQHAQGSSVTLQNPQQLASPTCPPQGSPVAPQPPVLQPQVVQRNPQQLLPGHLMALKNSQQPVKGPLMAMQILQKAQKNNIIASCPQGSPVAPQQSAQQGSPVALQQHVPQPPVVPLYTQQPVKEAPMTMPILQQTPKGGIDCQQQGSKVGSGLSVPQPPIAMQVLQQVAMRIQPQTPPYGVNAYRPDVSAVAPQQSAPQPPMAPKNSQQLPVIGPVMAMQNLQKTQKHDSITCQRQGSSVALQQYVRPPIVPQNPQPSVPGLPTAMQLLGQSQKEEYIACRAQLSSQVAPQQPIPVGGTNISIADNLFQVVPGGLIGLADMMNEGASVSSKPIFSEKTGNYYVELVTINNVNYLTFKYPLNHKAFMMPYGQQHQGTFIVVITPTTCSEDSGGSVKANKGVVLAIGHRGIESVLPAQIGTLTDVHKAFVVQLEDCNGNTLQPPVAQQNPQQPVSATCQPQSFPVAPQQPVLQPQQQPLPPKNSQQPVKGPLMAMQILQKIQKDNNIASHSQDSPVAPQHSAPQGSPVAPQPLVAPQNSQQPVKGPPMTMPILQQTPKGGIDCQQQGPKVGPGLSVPQPPIPMQVLQQVAIRIQQQTLKAGVTAFQPDGSKVAPQLHAQQPPMASKNPQQSVKAPVMSMQILPKTPVALQQPVPQPPVAPQNPQQPLPGPLNAQKNSQQPVMGPDMAMQKTPKDGIIDCQQQGSPVASQNLQPPVPAPPTEMQILQDQETPEEDATPCQPQQGSPVAPQQPVRPPMVPQIPKQPVPWPPTITMHIQQESQKGDATACQPQKGHVVAPQQPVRPPMVSENPKPPVPAPPTEMQILQETQKEDATACQPQQGSPGAPQQPMPSGGTKTSIANNLFQVVPGGLIGLAELMNEGASRKPIVCEKTSNYYVELVTINKINYLVFNRVFKNPANHTAVINTYGQPHQDTIYVHAVITPTKPSKGSDSAVNSNQGVVLAIGHRGVKKVISARMVTQADGHQAFVVQLQLALSARSVYR